MASRPVDGSPLRWSEDYDSQHKATRDHFVNLDQVTIPRCSVNHKCMRRDLKPPAPILELTRLATSTRITLEELEKGGQLGLGIFPPLFVHGALTSPALLSYILGCKYSGLNLTRQMLPGLLKTIYVADHEARDGCNVQGFVVLGRSGVDEEAVDEFYGTDFTRLRGEVIVPLHDGTALCVEAVVWRPNMKLMQTDGTDFGTSTAAPHIHTCCSHEQGYR